MKDKDNAKDQVLAGLSQLCRQLAELKGEGGELPAGVIPSDSEAEYRLLINNLPNVIIKGYKNWSVDFINDKIEPMTG